MVVCKCRKATNLYCFVHKVPVCGECICFSEHLLCVVRTYSEWVIDGDYDWPEKCSLCHEVLQSGDTAVSRLGCLHVLHSGCFSKHLQSFPLHTAPAGYTCPACSVPIWPPKNVKDHNCALSSRLKEIITQNGLSKSLLGNDVLASQPLPASSSTPSEKFSTLSQGGVQRADPANGSQSRSSAIEQPSDPHEFQDGVIASNTGGPKELNGVVDSVNKAHSSINMAALSKITSPTTVHPGAMTRKTSARMEKAGLNYAEYDGEDEDEASRKYSRRGPLQKQAMKYFMPFSSNASPMLPITTPSRKDDHAEELIEGRPRRRARSSGVNTKKVLLVVAIMSCMVTMLLLYYRLLQGTPSEDRPELNSQG